MNGTAPHPYDGPVTAEAPAGGGAASTMPCPSAVSATLAFTHVFFAQ